MAQKIIIDTDPGHDDAMVLMLACKSPEFDVLAVTTVAGNSTIENTTRNARYILDFINRGDIPIYSGAAKPMERDLVQASVHGESGLTGIDPTNESKLTGDAVEQILSTVADNPGEVTIVAIGPLTNIAQAINKDPNTMKQVAQIVAMGGAIDVPGNKSRVAEFNTFVDPEAADIVIRSPIPKTLVPLDACNQARLGLDDFRKIKDQPLQALILQMMKPYIANLTKDAGVPAALMYDPVAIFYLLQPGSCQTKRYNIQIETKGEITRGMTVADRRTITDNQPPNATLVMGIKVADFVDRFIDTLNSS